MRRLRSILRLIIKFFNISQTQRVLLIEASVFLLVARLLLVFVPFRYIVRAMGGFLPPTPKSHIILRRSPSEDIELAREISCAIKRAVRYVPFRAVCLPQAMAARRMLALRGVPSIIHFGATRNLAEGTPLETHAWLSAQGVEVTGYPLAYDCTEIACVA